MGMNLPSETRLLRQFLASALLREYAHPCILPTVGNGYECSCGTESQFTIKDSFTGTYQITIKKVA